MDKSENPYCAAFTLVIKSKSVCILCLPAYFLRLPRAAPESFFDDPDRVEFKNAFLPSNLRQTRIPVEAAAARVKITGTTHEIKNTPIPKSGRKITYIIPMRGAMAMRPNGDILR